MQVPGNGRVTGTSRLFKSLCSLFLLGTSLAGAFASDNWDSRFLAPPMTDGEIHAVATQGTAVYAGGSFTCIGGVNATGIAKWNGTTWESLGSGVDGEVYALAVNGNNLYVGGWFWTAGDVPAQNVAVWNGSSWSALGDGIGNDTFDAYVDAITFIGANAYVGGYFDLAGTVNATNIARWSGTAWAALGKGIRGATSDPDDYSEPASVKALATDGTNLYAGGSFTLAGNLTATNLARWNGTAWSAVGGGITSQAPPISDSAIASVNALATKGTNLYVGGVFNRAGSVDLQNLAVWNGVLWSGLGGPPDDAVNAICITSNSVYVGGDFTTLDGLPASAIARWSSGAWECLASGIDDGSVETIAISGNKLFVAGAFTSAGNTPAGSIAQWNGISWSGLSGGLANGPGGDVNVIAVSGTNVYVGGNFTVAGPTIVNSIAKWTGNDWQALGAGIQGTVHSIAPNGSDLYLAGAFSKAGSLSATNVARWNGVAWEPLADGFDEPAYALLVSGSNVFAGGDFTASGTISLNHIARWNGTTWQPLGEGIDGPVYALAMSGTDLYAGGDFAWAGATAAANIARWNGQVWLPVGAGVEGPVHTLAAAGTELYAGGEFTVAGANYNASGIARWNGSEWSDLAGGLDGTVLSIAVSGTDLFVAGNFSGTIDGAVTAFGAIKWNGSGWTPLGWGLDNQASTIACQNSLVYVGGPFTTAGEQPSYHFGIWNDAKPFIWVQPDPAEQILSRGDSIDFNVSALGAAPLHFQWQRNGSNIVGATATSYSRTNLQSVDAGLYTVVVSNSFGTAISTPASVLLDSAVVFSDTFESGNLSAWKVFGSGTTLSLSPSPAHNGSYSALCNLSSAKMYHNLGLELQGRTRATFWIFDNAGTQNRWWGEVRGYSGAGVGGGTLQQVLSIGSFNAPFGTNQTGFLDGETVSPTHYQGQVYAGEHRGYFNLNDPPTPGRASGWHKFQIERQSDDTTIDFFVDDEFRREIPETTVATWDSVLIGSVGSGSVSGSVWFDDVTIEYLDAPEILTQPLGRATNLGASVTFSVQAAGNLLSYQWLHDSTPIPGATAKNLTVSSLKPTDIGDYSVIVANGIGSVLSEPATLQLNQAPTILAQPRSQTAPAGANLVLQVAAQGIPSNLSYQWRWNGTNISGAKTSDYVLLNALTSNSGSYSVVVTNTAGSVTSAVAVLTITNSPPLILTGPRSQSQNLGGAATFSVLAAGNEPRAYQWRFNGANIPAATASSYRRASLQLSDQGSYSVVVSNAFGTITSAAATLELNLPPTILVQPQGGTVAAGADVVIQTFATGSEPLSYQWRFNNTDLPGEESSWIVLHNVQSRDSGSYSVYVSNLAGHALSSDAALVVNGPPSILEQPQSQTVACGSNATFSVQAVGSGTLTYQWFCNNALVPTATNSTYSLTNIQSTNLGLFSVLVSNLYGATLSEEAVLQFPGFVVFSENFEAGLTNWSVLSNSTALALSTGFHSGSNGAVAGLSSDQMMHRFSVPPENHSRAAFWIFDDKGTQTRWFGQIRGTTTAGLEQILALGKYDAPFPTNQTGELQDEELDSDFYQARIAIGANAGYFNLDDFDAPMRSFGWHLFEVEREADNSTIDFYVDGRLCRTITETIPASWTFIVIGSTGDGTTPGNVWFDDLTVEYLDPPTILQEPQSFSARPGGTASFTALATGNVTSYQWRLNGNNLPGATTSSLTLNPVTIADLGSYSVLVMNGVGPALSRNAELFFADPPSITAQPASQTVLHGADVSFTVTATGAEPLAYQWLWNGSTISGATAPFYTLPIASYEHAGIYSVIVSNSFGSMTSSNALLTVRPPQTPGVTCPTLVSNQLIFTLTGESGGRYSVQTSTNLIDWLPAPASACSNGLLRFLDTPTNHFRFYRAIGN